MSYTVDQDSAAACKDLPAHRQENHQECPRFDQEARFEIGAPQRRHHDAHAAGCA